MKIGIPKEIKVKEDRVAITPQGVSVLTKKEHTVFVEKSAGIGSGFSDEEYENAGAVILATPEEVYEKAEIILKVKEPQPSEYKLLKKNQILVTPRKRKAPIRRALYLGSVCSGAGGRIKRLLQASCTP